MKKTIESQIAYLEKRRGFHKENKITDFTDCAMDILVDFGRYLQLLDDLDYLKRNPQIRKYNHVS